MCLMGVVAVLYAKIRDPTPAQANQVAQSFQI